MTEPDVTLTDFALTLECAIIAVVLSRRRCRAGRAAHWWVLNFAAASMASLCGGLVHGFYRDQNSLGYAVFWPVALLAIGVNALAASAIGANLLFNPPVARRLILLVSLLVAVYSAIVLIGFQAFLVAVGIALPATAFLFVALVVAHRRDCRPGALLAAVGVATTLAAILIQQFGVSAHPVYFDHNAMAHVVQAVSLALVFVGGLRLLDSPVADSNRRVSCLHDVNS